MSDRMLPPHDDSLGPGNSGPSIGAGSGESPAPMEPPIHITARAAITLCNEVIRTLPWHRRLRLIIPRWFAERAIRKLEVQAQANTYPGNGRCGVCGVRDDEPCGRPDNLDGCG